MAESTGTIVSTILQRVRDLGGTAVSRADIRTILTHIERLINWRDAQDQTTVSLTTQVSLLVYPLALLSSTLLRVTRIQYQGRDLPEIPWRSIIHADRHWFRRRGGKLVAWARYGHDFIILYPGLSDTTTVSVIGATETAELTDDSVSTTLRDEALREAIDLTTAAVLLQFRAFGTLNGLLKRLTA